VPKVWRQLQRKAIAAPRCQVARLMKNMGSAGVVRGKTVKNTQRQFPTVSPRRGESAIPGAAPDALWVSDFTYVVTWHGFVYIAFFIDTFARRIVVSRSARADLVLDTLRAGAV
jgi:putative transposase